MSTNKPEYCEHCGFEDEDLVQCEECGDWVCPYCRDVFNLCGDCNHKHWEEENNAD